MTTSTPDRRAAWVTAVADGATDLGYADWLAFSPTEQALAEIGTGRFRSLFVPSFIIDCDGRVADVDWADSHQNTVDLGIEGHPMFDGFDVIVPGAEPVTYDLYEVTETIIDGFDRIVTGTAHDVLHRLAQASAPGGKDRCRVQVDYDDDGGVTVSVIVPGAERDAIFTISAETVPYQPGDDDPNQWVVSLPWHNRLEDEPYLISGVDVVNGFAWLDRPEAS